MISRRSVTTAAAAFAGLALAAGVSTGCATSGADVSVVQGAGPAVTPGATFAWAPRNPDALAAADPRVTGEAFQSRLQQAIEAALTAKGYRRADDPGGAQLLVAYHVGLQSRTATTLRPNSAGGNCGYYNCVQSWGSYGPPTSEVRTINYTQGRLVLDLVDRGTGQLAWRAVSTKRVDSLEAPQDRLNAILTDTTRSLPGP